MGFNWTFEELRSSIPKGVVERLTLIKESLNSFETSVTLCQSTYCNISEDSNIHQHYCEEQPTPSPPELISSILGKIKFYFESDVWYWYQRNGAS